MTVRARWQDLAAEHRRWIVVHAGLVTAVINLVLGGFIAWMGVRSQHWVPLWTAPAVGKSAILTDTVGTFFFLPFMTCLFVTTFVWIEARAGRMPPLRAVTVPVRYRGGRARRGAALGITCMAALSPVAAAALFLLSRDGMSTGTFVLYKGVLGVVLGAIVTPVIALWAMADAPDARPSSS